MNRLRAEQLDLSGNSEEYFSPEDAFMALESLGDTNAYRQTFHTEKPVTRVSHAMFYPFAVFTAFSGTRFAGLVISLWVIDSSIFHRTTPFVLLISFLFYERLAQRQAITKDPIL